jgi:hypothetical protein
MVILLDLLIHPHRQRKYYQCMSMYIQTHRCRLLLV